MTEQTPETMSPEDFDLDAWLTDAALHEDSVDVYKRGDLVGALAELERRIRDYDGIDDKAGAERSLEDDDERSALIEQYEELLDDFVDSRLTVYVRAVSEEKVESLRAKRRAALDAGTVDVETAKRNFSDELLLLGIVGVKGADGVRYPIHWTKGQLRKLENKIGKPQLELIVQTQLKAQTTAPVVTADFLHGASGTSEEPDAG